MENLKTWEVIKYLLENPDSNKVFVSKTKNGMYDIYRDDYSKEFFFSFTGCDKGCNWIYKTSFSALELNNILFIDNWKG